MQRTSDALRAAWYHKQLPPELQDLDLPEILPLAEKFAVDELIPALARGGFLSLEEKKLCIYISKI